MTHVLLHDILNIAYIKIKIQQIPIENHAENDRQVACTGFIRGKVGMIGAIIGDTIGSIYEHHNIKTMDFPLFTGKSRPTDDSVLTIAVSKALMDTMGQDEDSVYTALVAEMQYFGRLYPNAGYGGTFKRWIFSENPKPYGSYGNGSAMRVSSVGWMYPTLEETRCIARLTSVTTHNHREGVKGAECVASAVFLARTGAKKADIKRYIEEEFDYNLDLPLDAIRESYGFDVTCQGSVPQAIRAFLEGYSFENAVRLAVSIGGDSDTIACITGGIADAMYGVPEELQKAVLSRLPEPLLAQVKRFHTEYYQNNRT